MEGGGGGVAPAACQGRFLRLRPSRDQRRRLSFRLLGPARLRHSQADTPLAPGELGGRGGARCPLVDPGQQQLPSPTTIPAPPRPSVSVSGVSPYAFVRAPPCSAEGERQAYGSLGLDFRNQKHRLRNRRFPPPPRVYQLCSYFCGTSTFLTLRNVLHTRKYCRPDAQSLILLGSRITKLFV